ncbi:MAG: hypothetical protein HPY50_04130 [Firmicutes bacterium]|nr:hypothetical protein [Bacillota bacterium]
MNKQISKQFVVRRFGKKKTSYHTIITDGVENQFFHGRGNSPSGREALKNKNL